MTAVCRDWSQNRLESAFSKRCTIHQLRETDVFDKMGKKLFCPHMESDVYPTGGKFAVHACDSGRHKRNRHLHLFTASQLLPFEELVTLRLLPRTVNKNLFMLVIMDQYLKPKLTIATSKKTARYVANMSLHRRKVPHSILKYLLMVKSPQFGNRLFASLCEFLGQERRTETACNP